MTDSELAQLQARVYEQDAEIASLETSLDEANETIDEFKTENSTIAARVTELEEELAEYAHQYNDCDSLVATLKARIAELENRKPAMLVQEVTGRWHAFEDASDLRVLAVPINSGYLHRGSVQEWIWYAKPQS